MYNQDVIELYDRVPVGTKVTVTWQRFQGGGAIVSNDEIVKPVVRRSSQTRASYRSARPVVSSAE